MNSPNPISKSDLLWRDLGFDLALGMWTQACQLIGCIIVYPVHWPPLRTRFGSGPLNSLMTIVMSETMSRVGTKIQNVTIRMKSFLSNSAMTFKTTNNKGGPLVTEQEAREKAFYRVHSMWALYIITSSIIFWRIQRARKSPQEPQHLDVDF